MPVESTIEPELETDGRWIAEVTGLAGVFAHGSTEDEAVARVQAVARVRALALRVVVDRLEHDEAGHFLFGVRADYMAQFRDFLESEGLPADPQVELVVPIVRTAPASELPTIRLKERVGGVQTGFGDAFRRLGPVPTLAPPEPSGRPATAWLQDNKVVVNWYPKIQAMSSLRVTEDDGWRPDVESFTPQHVSLLDIDALYFELERFKAERGWYNLNLPRTAIERLLADTTWYRLEIPSAQMKLDSMEKVRAWQELAGVLLKRYVEGYYSFCRREWEMPHLEYQPLAPDDRKFPRASDDPPTDGYRVTVDANETETIARIQELAERIERGDYRAWFCHGLGTIWSKDHLYQPLPYSDGPNPFGG